MTYVRTYGARFKTQFFDHRQIQRLTTCPTQKKTNYQAYTWLDAPSLTTQRTLLQTVGFAPPVDLFGAIDRSALLLGRHLLGWRCRRRSSVDLPRPVLRCSSEIFDGGFGEQHEGDGRRR